MFHLWNAIFGIVTSRSVWMAHGTSDTVNTEGNLMQWQMFYFYGSNNINITGEQSMFMF